MTQTTPKDITVDWPREYWNEVHLKIAESERQFDRGETIDAYQSLNQARLKYGL